MNPLLPLAASVCAGAALGILVASTGTVAGVRPRRAIRQRHRFLALVSGFATAVALGASLLGVVGTHQTRPLLALTCGAIVLLLSLATWVLLIEPDDDGGEHAPDEPEWWPAFERDLAAWVRRTRSPVSSRR